MINKAHQNLPLKDTTRVGSYCLILKKDIILISTQYLKIFSDSDQDDYRTPKLRCNIQDN